MKITKSDLQKIIKAEVKKVLAEDNLPLKEIAQKLKALGYSVEIVESADYGYETLIVDSNRFRDTLAIGYENAGAKPMLSAGVYSGDVDFPYETEETFRNFKELELYLNNLKK
jgi:hypothetical protein